MLTAKTKKESLKSNTSNLFTTVSQFFQIKGFPMIHGIYEVYLLSSHDHIFGTQYLCVHTQTSAQNQIKFCLSTARTQCNSSAAGFAQSLEKPQ